MIDPNKMIAVWEHDDGLKVTNFLIVDVDKQPAYTHDWSSSSGASDYGWMDGTVCNSPIGLYAHVATAYGFRDRKTACKALEEFEKVAGQDWARELRRRAGDESL